MSSDAPLSTANWLAPQAELLGALDAAVRAERLSRALLLTGPAGVGKAEVARWFARRLWCAAAEPPCGSCPVCRKVMSGNHPDLEWLSRASLAAEEGKTEVQELTVGAVRALGEALAHTPLEASGKLAVVHGAEDLNEEAQNALLKLLEEPPGRSRLLLVAHQQEGLLDTVRSRCQELRVRALRPEEIAALFPDLDGLRARLARGCPGRVEALRALPVEELLEAVDRCLAGELGAAAFAGALAARLEALAELPPDVDQASARRLVLEVALARVLDLAWWTAGGRAAPELGPSRARSDRMAPPEALTRAGAAVHEALRDLHRNLPVQVALLALGQEFVAAGVGAEGAPTP